MTLEIVEFKCPTCGHQVGEEEYKLVCNMLEKKINDACGKQIENIRTQHYAEIEDY